MKLTVSLRQRALKALDERLSKATQQIEWPSLEEAAGNSSSSGDEQTVAAETVTPGNAGGSGSPASAERKTETSQPMSTE